MILTFDIETVPDERAGKQLYELDGINHEEVAKAMLASRRLKVPDADFLPLHMHRIVAISVALRWDEEKFSVTSLGVDDSNDKEENPDEKKIIEHFFRGIEKHTPILVSWNGNSFDLPVIQYRAMVHSIPSRIYWDTGKFSNDFRYNNYMNRYHERHVDIMDLLARNQLRAAAALHEIAVLLGFPGKMGLDNKRILETFLKGKVKKIRNYCEIDVLNTYLVYRRLQFVRGHDSREQHEQEIDIVRNWLKQAGKEKKHFKKFLDEWNKADNQSSANSNQNSEEESNLNE